MACLQLQQDEGPIVLVAGIETVFLGLDAIMELLTVVDSFVEALKAVLAVDNVVDSYYKEACTAVLQAFQDEEGRMAEDSVVEDSVALAEGMDMDKPEV
jgi:hypothetical protein